MWMFISTLKIAERYIGRIYQIGDIENFIRYTEFHGLSKQKDRLLIDPLLHEILPKISCALFLYCIIHF